jgi:hypothetical protein
MSKISYKHDISRDMESNRAVRPRSASILSIGRTGWRKKFCVRVIRCGKRILGYQPAYAHVAGFHDDNKDAYETKAIVRGLMFAEFDEAKAFIDLVRANINADELSTETWVV